MNYPAARAIDERYQKLRTIGSGGIGTVFEARQAALGRSVALKELRELFGFFDEKQRMELQRRFAREVGDAAKLSHPHIALVIDANTARGFPYVVTEYVTGGSLRDILDRAEEIPPQFAVKVFLQVLHGLGHAHGMGVVHRGLKPENVLFDSGGNVKLSDFGMTRVVERDRKIIKQVYIGMSSVAYLPPEQLANPADVDQRGDLYAAGIILYEMLARRLPGRRSPMPAELHKGMPKIIDDVFDKLTQDDAEDRYEDVDAVLDAFYGSPSGADYVKERGSVLFGKNPIEDLELRPAPEPEPEPEPEPDVYHADEITESHAPLDALGDAGLEHHSRTEVNPQALENLASEGGAHLGATAKQTPRKK